MNKFTSKIISKKLITSDVIEVDMSVPSDFQYEPGQFVNITVTDSFKRPYSILEHKNDSIKIIVGIRFPGKGSDFFNYSDVGTETEALGPLGKFICKYNENTKVFVATGTGIAPFIPMIKKSLETSNSKIILIAGFKTSEDDIALPYLESEIRKNKIEYHQCISQDVTKRDNFTYEGRVTEVIKSLDIDYSNSDFYICGRNEMIVQIKEFLSTKNVQNIYLENYG